MRGEKDEVEVGGKVAGRKPENLTADERGSTLIRKSEKALTTKGTKEHKDDREIGTSGDRKSFYHRDHRGTQRKIGDRKKKTLPRIDADERGSGTRQ
jgi:hypothetical protein